MGDRKTVYLTFDDGIQPGTEEVFELLVKYDMRATFFMTGAHVAQSEKVNPGLLSKINAHQNFLIGNHSASHANSKYYVNYYSGGGVLLTSQKRRSVLEDFQRCDEMLSELLNLPEIKQFQYARLPGRNIWRTQGINENSWGARDSREEADELSKAGYQIFGWDLEWKMDFDGTNEHSDYDPEVDPPQGYNPKSKTYRNTPELDRPITAEGAMQSAVYQHLHGKWYAPTKKADKAILLMHERAFRTYKLGEEKKYLSMLESLLKMIKRSNFATDVISNY